MDAWRFILASLRHYRRIHIAVALGVAVATSVLTGALLVGDSVRGSLRNLTLQRLGRIDSVLVAGHLFRAELAHELAANDEFKKDFVAAEPALLLNGTLQTGNGNEQRRATGISVVGCEPSFWSLGEGGPAKPLARGEVALTEPVARELIVEAGDNVLLRIPIATAIPADSTLGEKSDTSRSRTLKVAAVLPVEGLARFSIVPSQQLPRNAFVPLAVLQDLLKQPGEANTILVATDDTSRATGKDSSRVLEKALRPALEDYGLKIEALKQPIPIIQISADTLVLPTAVEQAAEAVFRNGAQPVVTYLANTIEAGEAPARRKIPYSTIAGVDSTARLGPLFDDSGQPIELADERPGQLPEIALNRWAAEDLGVKVGDKITVTFYEPESTHGRLREHQPPPAFKLRAIVDLKTADGKPTAAADPKLTPELPGVTDQKSISDWDLPFKLVETIRPKDEEYWNQYRTTPKAFVSLATAKRLWASRWGATSLLRLPAAEFFRASPPDGNDLEPDSASFKEALGTAAYQLQGAIVPSSLGMTFLPVKEQGLAASAGTTPFEVLFVSFSFFLIAAAVMLVALLFQLGIEQRASELGTLAAVGIGRRRTTMLLAREGIIVAALGATVGVAFGVGYAWLMVFGLRTWWLAAISTPFLTLHVSWLSLSIGWVVGIIVSWLTIRWSIRRLVRQPVTRLLAGAPLEPSPFGRGQGEGALVFGKSPSPRPSPVGRGSKAREGRLVSWPVFRGALAVLVVVQCVVGFFLQGEARAGIFLGSGAAMLMLLLGEIRHRLRHLGPAMDFHRSFSLLQLSMLNTARNPGRSTLTIGLVAAASFLIVAVSAFHLDTGEGGTGGFDLVATSDLPIYYDLNTPEGRRELGFSDEANKQLEGWRVYALRVAAGENASCLNLYQPKQPRVLGVPQSLIERGGFAWSAVDKQFTANPWKALDAKLKPDESGREVVPVVLDMSTAVYSLHLKGVGSRYTIRDAAGRPAELQVVGLLENSVLQGNLLVSETNFLKMFPETGGYRFFLIENGSRHSRQAEAGVWEKRDDITDAGGTRSMPATLESTLAEEGFDATDAREQLGQFLAVQNTYLSTFQSLGALGLLLGTIGLAVVQLRSVLERRSELALMRAEGFRAARLIRIVIWENALLLVGGLAVGVIAAAIALIPQWAPNRASVPWSTLGLLLGAIAVVGLLAGWLATRSTLRAPIVGALRGD
jgi:putative ABC transport system permease protein